MNSMANRVMRHLLGYSRNLYTGIGDHRFSDILVVSHSKFHGRSTSLPGLQCRYTGDSYNLVGVASPY